MVHPVGHMFENKPSIKNTRSAVSNKLSKPVPGYQEVAANRLAQVWNMMDLSSAESLTSVKSCAHKWCRQNENLLK